LPRYVRFWISVDLLGLLPLDGEETPLLGEETPLLGEETPLDNPWLVRVARGEWAPCWIALVGPPQAGVWLLQLEDCWILRGAQGGCRLN